VTALLLLSGLVLLFVGGELLVRGAVRLALAIGTSPLIIGLTVVAFGTSSPELAVSVLAGLRGSSDLAVGNVVGSNIFNVLFILGISALIVPLVVSQQLIRIDVPIMIAVSLLFLIFALDRMLSPAESIVLVALLLVYIVVQIFISGRTTVPSAGVYEGRWYIDVVLILLGLALLLIGSRWFLDGAVSLAHLLGATELVIGLTIVAAGTSLPEVATSVIAGIRGQRDIAVGNIIGSNIFNLLAVLGLTGLISARGIPISAAAAATDIPIMLAVAILCLPIFITGYTVDRREAVLFLGYYALYVTYLMLDATQYDALNQYRNIVLIVIVPLTMATALGFALRNWFVQRRARSAVRHGGSSQ
jgi:cation:H+ antiporter